MTEYTVRLGAFEVEVEGESHIDAAFEGARWVKERAREGRLDALVYETQKRGETQRYSTDLEEVVAASYDAAFGPDTSDTQTLPEDNQRSHELFDALKQIIAEMRAHRSDDLIGAWYLLETAIEETTFPEIQIDSDGIWTCPHCKCEIEINDGWVEDLLDKSWDVQSNSFEMVDSDTGGDPHLNTWNDQPADWSSLYVEHGCGSAVSIPPTIHIEYS